MAFAAARMILKDKRRKSKEDFAPPPPRTRSKVWMNYKFVLIWQYPERKNNCKIRYRLDKKFYSKTCLSLDSFHCKNVNCSFRWLWLNFIYYFIVSSSFPFSYTLLSLYINSIWSYYYYYYYLSLRMFGSFPMQTRSVSTCSFKSDTQVSVGFCYFNCISSKLNKSRMMSPVIVPCIEYLLRIFV